jgi:hypothetical protein
MLIISAFQVGSVSKFGIGIRDDAQAKITEGKKERPRFQLNEAGPKDVPLADPTTSPEHGSQKPK